MPFIIFLAGMLPVLYNIDTMGLAEPTEALIGSISRAMVDNNDMSTPTVYGIKFFELPPGIYWITTFGIRLFGSTELGVRFFLSFAAGISAVCIYFIAKLFFGFQCGVISCLLLCTSFFFQAFFRILSASAYCATGEALLCLCFFYYLNKPSNALRLTFWIVLSLAFLTSGFGVLLPLIAITLVAILTGQKHQIKKLYMFIPGLSTFLVFGLGWYLIQFIINPGLMTFLLFSLPYKKIFTEYNGLPFFIFMLFPFIAVFPWTAILFKELKNKIKTIKEDPAVAYLIAWAFIPYIVRVCMTSREASQFLSSLPPLLILTAPAFQAMYFRKYEPDDPENVEMIRERRLHNLFIVVSSSAIGMTSVIWGYIHFDDARIISQTSIFFGIFWMFSALIMLAFMIKNLNKSILIPAAMLIPSVLLFTVPAIKGNEPLAKDKYLPSQFLLLQRLGKMPKEQKIICCNRFLYGWYFYTGRNPEFYNLESTFDFTTKEFENLNLPDEASLFEVIDPELTYFVFPTKDKEPLSEKLKLKFEIAAEENDMSVLSPGGKIF